MKTYEEMLEVLCYHETLYMEAKQLEQSELEKLTDAIKEKVPDSNMTSGLISKIEHQLFGRYDAVGIAYGKSIYTVMEDVSELMNSKLFSGEDLLDDEEAYSFSKPVSTVH